MARNGLQIGGPGRFEVAAHDLDLGISAGIRSLGPLNNPNLVKYEPGVFMKGADLLVTLSGDLKVTSSQIASLFGGGNIEVTALGRMDIGSQEQFVSDDTPKGIYSGFGGNVTVHAVGDVVVNGSRIATYGGGNISVISDTGDVDAGQGVNIRFFIPYLEIDPATGALVTQNQAVFGSGIVSLITDRNSSAHVGNISVTAARDILANSGGIVQLPFNMAKVQQSDASVILNAGRDIKANQSGVVGNNITLNAKGNIEGRVIATGNIDIKAERSVNVTALAGGGANVSGGSVSGSINSGGDANVSGKDSVSASVISTGGGASVSGNSSGAKVGAFASAAAPVAQKTTEDAATTIAKAPTDANSDDEEQKKKTPSVLTRSSGRVTVILPTKS